MTSRTYYHFRMPCQALCKIEHAPRACGLGAGDQWDCFAATALGLTLRADAARLANRPYHFAAQSALNGVASQPPHWLLALRANPCGFGYPLLHRRACCRALSPSRAAPSVLAAPRLPAHRCVGGSGRGSPPGFHAHDTGTEAAPSPHAVCRIPYSTRNKKARREGGLYAGRSLTAMEKCRPLSQKQTKR